MVYQALYRTYRPRRFGDLVGQEHIVRTLLNSVRQNKVGHAYLFSGPRGTGKTTVARILARAINCGQTNDGEPCDNCDRCKGSGEGLGVTEIDAASHGSVDDMRQLVAQVNQIPLSGGMMVYIIDEVHMLSKEAFNAFLKTLEEPPPHAVFVLATTEPGKLLPTIHSRCQHFAFRRLPLKQIADHIKWICEREKIPADDAAVRSIARSGDGSVRDSISVLEQSIAFEPDGLTLQGVRDVLGIPDRMDIRLLAGYMIKGDPGATSSAFEKLVQTGREPREILKELLSHFRDLLFAALNLEDSDLHLLPDEEREQIESQVPSLTVKGIHGAISSLAKCDGEIKFEDEAALLLEVHLLRLAAKFGKPSRTEVEAVPRPVEKPSEKVETFPAAKEEKPGTEAPPEKPERKSLTGGVSLKQKKPVEEKTAPIPEPEKPAEKKARPVKSGGSGTVTIPEDAEQLWRDALESLREVSVTDFILLAVTTPMPPPSEWPEHDASSPIPLKITIRYPSGMGLIARMVGAPSVMNRLVSRLEEVLERPIELRPAIERSEAGSGPAGSGEKQTGMADGDGPVPGASDPEGSTLFKGASRLAPKDPELNQIHNLIVNEFPDYKVDYIGPSG